MPDEPALTRRGKQTIRNKAMLKFILKRLLQMIPVLLGVTLFIFTLLQLVPGDPVDQMIDRDAPIEEKMALRESLGLNDPFLVRFFNYVKDIVTKFDFGDSYKNNQPVLELILEKFPNTLILAVASAVISVTLGIFLGCIAAAKQYSAVDNVSMFVALIGVSMPNFWQGLLLMLLFCLNLGWLPVSGFTSFKHVILPAITVGTSCCASIARMTRSSVLECIRQDYMDTARAKGQKNVVVFLRHGLRNALIPIVTSIGLQFGGLLGGSVLAEAVFAIPGIGKFIVESIKIRDYPCVLGSILFCAIVYSMVNLLVDVLYAVIDPRIKSSLI